MNDPSQVRVRGPLAPFAPGFRVELSARGYASGSAALQLQLAAELSRWLDRQGLDVHALTSARVEQFFEMRRARVAKLFVSPRSLRVLLGHLAEVGVLPPPEPVELTALEALVARYGRYLRHERQLGEGTAARYLYIARRFLQTCATNGVPDFDRLSLEPVTAFLIAECAAHSVGWAKCVAVGLRSLLRFLYLDGIISTPLAEAVPSPAGWRAGSVPKALAPGVLATVFSGCDRQSSSGRRDYAVLMLLGRMGLRAGEVAALELDDVGWRTGKLHVRGKGQRVDVLPLPVDVGRALADYVRRGRPLASGGALFRRIGAPHGALNPVTVTGIVYRACDRVGLPRVGAHRLRHTAATQMLGAGASLPEIAQVLRHRSPDTTAIYAKVDRLALAELARPWPGAAS